MRMLVSSYRSQRRRTGTRTTAALGIAVTMTAALVQAVALPSAVAEDGAVVIDFADQLPGAPPQGWSSLWRASDFTIADDPPRLTHVASTSGRQALAPDAVRDVAGDVEVAALVRTPDGVQGGTRMVLFLHAGGEAGAEDSYYADFRWASTQGPQFRLNRHVDGAFSTLRNGPILEQPPADTVWYQMVLQREGNELRFKAWPYGSAEPDGWMIETTDDTHHGGAVAVGHTTGGNLRTDWAYLAVGAPGDTPRAPAGLVPAPVMPDAPEVADGTGDQHLSVTWEPVEGADWYEVERDGELVASPWQLTAYADPLVRPEEAAHFRVRGVSAVLGAGAWSAPLSTTAPGHSFPDALTPFERSGGQVTPFQAEQDFLADIDAASDRVAVDQVGTTVEGRPINLARIGHPSAPDEAQVRDRPTLFVACTVHGNEWTPRESCLKFIRDLSLTDDPAIADVLAEHAVIVVPTVNPDGRAANTRENAQGLDVNRDYLSMVSPEARTVVDVLNRYQPEVVLDGHNCCDDSVVAMWSQNLNVSEDLRGVGRDVVHDGLLGTADRTGFTNTTSPLGTLGNPAIARNYAGLRHSVGMLNEVRGSAIAGRLQEVSGYPGAAVNRRLRAVAAFDLVLDTTLRSAVEQRDRIGAAVAGSIAASEANQNTIYFGGDETTDPAENEVIDPPPCGYVLGRAQHESAADLLDRHRVEASAAGPHALFVPMAQRSGSIAALMLDPRSPWSVTEGIVLDDRRSTVTFGDADSGVANDEVSGGCTISDLLHATWWQHSGELVRHADQVVRDLQSDGVLTAREAAAIRRAAARSGEEAPDLPAGPTEPSFSG